MEPAEIFVINLARSTTRMARLRTQLQRQGLAFERLEAVDGAALSAQELSQWYNEHTMHSYHKQLNAGEVACYLSHRLAWQTIVERQLPYAIILEDDINLTGTLSDAMAQLHALPDDWDYIKLAEHTRRRPVIHSEPISGTGMQRVTYQKVPARTCAQAVSLEGAKKLLAASRQIHRPIDIDLQYWWEKELRVFGLRPYPVVPSEEWDSEIDKTNNRSHARQDFWLKLKMRLAFQWQNYRANQNRLRELQMNAIKTN